MEKFLYSEYRFNVVTTLPRPSGNPLQGSDSCGRDTSRPAWGFCRLGSESFTQLPQDKKLEFWFFDFNLMFSHVSSLIAQAPSFYPFLSTWATVCSLAYHWEHNPSTILKISPLYSKGRERGWGWGFL